MQKRSIHRQVCNEWNVHDAVSTRRFKDDERLAVGMQGNMFLALNLKLGAIGEPNREGVEWTP